MPGKGPSWPGQTRLLPEVMQAIVSLWDSHPDSTGAPAVYEQLMPQRSIDGPVSLDATTADTSEEGFNVVHAFDSLADTSETRDIKTDL
ncbi:MAG TPA: hypothetical protein VFU12_20710 [Glycomyces sp.]|nr:hypothetical protein [Glycomyces sp.]